MSVPEDRGLTRSIDLGDPAAGADYVSQTVPTNALWKIRGFMGQFVTAAGGADRVFRVLFNDGTVDAGGVAAKWAQDPSLTHDYLGAGPGMMETDARATTTVTGQAQTIGFPDVPLPGGFVIDFDTMNIGASDNWGDGQLLVEEWIED